MIIGINNKTFKASRMTANIVFILLHDDIDKKFFIEWQLSVIISLTDHEKEKTFKSKIQQKTAK